MKEQLVEMTGLSPRVIRVWFQNKRCKDKKKSMMLNKTSSHHQHQGPGSDDGQVRGLFESAFFYLFPLAIGERMRARSCSIFSYLVSTIVLYLAVERELKDIWSQVAILCGQKQDFLCLVWFCRLCKAAPGSWLESTSVAGRVFLFA